MSELRFEAVSGGVLQALSAQWGPGQHVIVGGERDGTSDFVRLACGLLSARSGSVLLDQESPAASAHVRRGIATVCSDESLLPGHSVASAVALALRARGDARSADRVLEAAGLAELAAQRVGQLTPQAARAVALALALSHISATLLLLHEPLTLLGVVREAFLFDALTRFVDAGACVICCTARVEDAARLGGVHSVLERGVWRAEAPRSWVTMRVRTPEPERLAARLSAAPEIEAVTWAGGAELLVRGAEVHGLAHSVLAHARAESIRISALKADA